MQHERFRPARSTYCGFVDQELPGQHILAVFNGYAKDGAYLGGCSCPKCDGDWREYAYQNGRTVNVLADGGVVERVGGEP